MGKVKIKKYKCTATTTSNKKNKTNFQINYFFVREKENQNHIEFALKSSIFFFGKLLTQKFNQI